MKGRLINRELRLIKLEKTFKYWYHINNKITFQYDQCEFKNIYNFLIIH